MSRRSPFYALVVSGAVAAGNRHSAEAGAWALREGGTAVDAALASTFAAFVTEGPLTGPAGGGFVLLHEPGSEAVAIDCFFAVPSRAPADMDEVVIDFGDASTQVFSIGEASVAVPACFTGSRRRTFGAVAFPGSASSFPHSSLRAAESSRTRPRRSCWRSSSRSSIARRAGDGSTAPRDSSTSVTSSRPSI